MGNNESVPVVGEGATVLLWSDRHTYKITEVDIKKMTCTIQRYQPKRIDASGMSDCQTYEYMELTEETKHLVYRWGAWRQIIHPLRYTKEFSQKHKDVFSLAQILTPEEKIAVYAGDVRIQNVIAGITERTTEYSKINIIFGVLDEYYDYSF